jgi:hypothetical protein
VDADDEIRGLLAQLAATPADNDLRRRAAEALDLADRRREALALLEVLVNVTGHDAETGLPCLCTRCLPAAGMNAEAGGMSFERSFAVAGRRVLHFWMLGELAHQRASVRASVTQALRRRLHVASTPL